jgi:hypothetical protein
MLVFTKEKLKRENPTEEMTRNKILGGKEKKKM